MIVKLRPITRQSVLRALFITSIFNTLIAIFLSVFESGDGFWDNFFFSQCIGISICSCVMTAYHVSQKHKPVFQLIHVAVAVIVGSFVGTILGGIWADQSWGRFWGWDPKENGALLIVLWCAVMLHARWGGLVRERGFAAMAIFGNVITSFSWFGVNMLGVGLHSYGFMSSGLFWLGLFIASQLLLMLIALIPTHKWVSQAPSPRTR